MRKLLNFLNLLDASGNLSITNIAVIICITKMAIATQFGGMDAVALVSALMNYSHKRMVNSDAS